MARTRTERGTHPHSVLQTSFSGFADHTLEGTLELQSLAECVGALEEEPSGTNLDHSCNSHAHYISLG